ncbi:MAG: hypothetical protein LW823_00570 [Rickettsiales bacterium]|jgi:hypothetical protein|nr:hypothetical protein [Rickettsiales bacterium]
MASTATDKERDKTADQRAEDIAYTINHSLACTITDFINPIINSYTDGKIRGVGGCGHDHSKDGGHHDGHEHKHEHKHDHTKHDHHEHGPNCKHHHHEHPPKPKGYEKFKVAVREGLNKERLIQWTKGEFIGDFGAVPLTIATQRFAPGLMQGIRTVTEPIMGPIFKTGIGLSSKRWAKERGIAVDSPEYKEHVKAVYEHELSHFPQAVAWTGYSLALNVGYQMHADQSAYNSFTHKLYSKSSAAITGMAVTAGLVVAARVAAPHTVRRFDQWTSNNVLLPTTKFVGKFFGVDSDAVDRMVAHEREIKEGGWAAKLDQTKPSEERIR